MKTCKSCHSVMSAGAGPESFPRIERLLKFHGFVPAMVEQVAVTLGPMCDKCLKAWAKELRSN